MRDLLVIDALTTAEGAEAVFAPYIVAAIASIVILVPMLALCGYCFGSDDTPKKYPQQPQYPLPPPYPNQPIDPRYMGQHQQVPGPPVHVTPARVPNGPRPGFPNVNPSSGVHFVGQGDRIHQPQYPTHPPHVPASPPGFQRPNPQNHPPPSLSVARPSSGPMHEQFNAIEAALLKVCDINGGNLGKGKTLIRNSIRYGVSAAIADVSTSYSVDETVMMFLDKNKKARHMRLYEQLNLKDSMPLVSFHNDGTDLGEGGQTISLPPAIFVNRVKTLREALQSVKSLEERQHELFSIWNQLGKVLKVFHQRGWYLRDVTFNNIVYVRMGGTEGWTLLEFGNAGRERSVVMSSFLHARQVPPDLAPQLLSSEDTRLHISPAYDMWMLGTVVYEVMTGEPYWKSSMSEKQILEVLTSPNRKLPHEEKPVLSLVQNILVPLLHRDPKQRLTSSDLLKRLDQDMATAAVTINPGQAVPEDNVVLPS